MIILLSSYCGGGDRCCEVVAAAVVVVLEAAVAEEEESLVLVLLSLLIDVALIGFVSWWRSSVAADDGGCFESLLSWPWFSVADGCFPMALMTGSAERPNFLAARLIPKPVPEINLVDAADAFCCCCCCCCCCCFTMGWFLGMY